MTEKELGALFAYNLNRMLAEKGLKQADIIRMLGVGKATVSDWCSGVNVPRTPMFSALISALGAKASDFFKEKEPTPASGDGQAAPLDVKLMSFVNQLSPDGKKMLIAQLEVLLKSQSPAPDSRG